MTNFSIPSQDTQIDARDQQWLAIVKEAVESEREGCAALFDQPHMEYFGREIQDAIRSRVSLTHATQACSMPATPKG